MKLNKFLSLVLLLSLFGLSIASEVDKKIFITSVRKIKENEFEVVFNGLILIREVKLHKIRTSRKEILELEFPKYISSDGREYYQVKILSDNLYEEIKKYIVSSETEALKFNNQSFPDFKIKKFSPYTKKHSKLRINASVVFEDALEIDCKIMEDEYKNVYVLWPSEKNKNTNKWVKKVEFLSVPYQKIIEKQLIDRYKVYKLEKGL